MRYIATLPSRPPCHERSISAPGNDWRQHYGTDFSSVSTGTSLTSNPSVFTSRQLNSPRDLPPLMIPTQYCSHSPSTRQRSQTRRSGSIGSNETIFRSARADDSPRSKTPYTPLTGSQTASTPLSSMTSSSTLTASTVTTPLSATTDTRLPLTQWTPEANPGVLHTYKETTVGLAQNMNVPMSVTEIKPPIPNANHHRRNISDSSSIAGSIMDRGRPSKKSDTNPITRSRSKRSKSAERRAFENLPKGWKAPDAIQMLESSEIAALQKQAAQQTLRFEVMRKEDVDTLSKVSP